jgi:hypothetical protein
VITGVFDDKADDLFTYYTCTLTIRDRILGGVPSDAHLIEAWIMRNMGVTRREEVQRLTLQTLSEITGIDISELELDPTTTFENLKEAAQAIAGKSQTTVFKRNTNGLYIESRQVKAMLREACHILWPSNRGTTKWGGSRTKNKEGAEALVGGKAPKSYLIESISIEPLHIPLGVLAPTGIDLAVQHIVDRAGPRSALSYYEYVEQCDITLVVVVLRDQIPEEVWYDLWRYCERHGLGAKRSQDHGRFKCVGWRRVPQEEARILMDPGAPQPLRAAPEPAVPSGRGSRLGRAVGAFAGLLGV